MSLPVNGEAIGDQIKYLNFIIARERIAREQ
jgi:hypothetical protein